METAFKSACELAQMIREKEIGCEELLDYYLARVEKYNPALNAIVVMDVERAREEACHADQSLARGRIYGPLHGVPMTIKESYSVAGLPSTFGQMDLAGNIATEDALPVKRLKAAGAVIFGKTNVPMYLADFQSYNDVYGTTSNPWDLECAPGGSSGGSAAVLAAGLAGFESGSDIGGSIRNPAHYCGIFGHKPSWGLLPPRGHALPGILAPSDLSVLGPLGRRAEDLELGVNVMGGCDEIQSTGYRLELAPLRKRNLGQLKIAVWPNYKGAPVNQDMESRVRDVAQTIATAGGEIDYDARPAFDPAEEEEVYQALLQVTMASRRSDEDFAKLCAEVDKLAPEDQSLKAKTLRLQVLSHRDYQKANERRTHFRWAWHEFFKKYDALLAPIMATAAFKHDHRPMHQRTLLIDDQKRPYFEQVFWAGLASCSYLPATVIPTGPDMSGLPIGVQIIGPELGDMQTIGIARLLEATGYTFQPPPDYD